MWGGSLRRRVRRWRPAVREGTGATQRGEHAIGATSRTTWTPNSSSVCSACSTSSTPSFALGPDRVSTAKLFSRPPEPKLAQSHVAALVRATPVGDGGQQQEAD